MSIFILIYSNISALDCDRLRDNRSISLVGKGDNCTVSGRAMIKREGNMEYGIGHMENIFLWKEDELMKA